MFRPLAIYLGLRYGTARSGTPLVGFLSRVSAVGLMLGVALLILVLAVMNGFDREMRERILSLVPHATINGIGGLQDWESVVEVASASNAVTGAAPYAQVQAMLMARNQARAVMLQGVVAKYESALSIVDETVVDGDFGALDKGSDGVVISRQQADALGLKVGDSLALVVPNRSGLSSSARPTIFKARVLAVYDSKTEIDNFLAYVPLEFAQRMAGLGDSVSGVQLRVDDLMLAGAIAREILNDLGPGLVTRDWTRTHGNLFEAIQLSKKLVSLLVFIIIAVAAFNVVTAMIMVVRDKRGDIAILQTMGMERAQIMRLFMCQGFVVGLIGTAAGVAVGVLLASYVTELVQWLEALLDYQFLKSDVYPVTYLPTDIRVGDVALVSLVAMVLTLVATLYPAWRAANVLPAEALRYDK